MKTIGLASCFAIGLALSTAAQALDVDPKLPPYQPVPVGSAVSSRLDPIRWAI